jgi:hypothetical protein
MDRPAFLAAGARAYSMGRLDDAASAYRTILAHTPQDAEALSNLAAVLTTAQCPEAAEQACRAALAIQPRYWAALANLGNALHRQLRYEAAINAYHAALEEHPRHASAWTNLGVALNEQWAMDDALVAHDAACHLAPLDAQIRCNRAMALLAAGRFAEGFAEFEWRWRTPGMAPHGMRAPAWTGQDPAGRTILLHAEGGFGDTLHFIRYAPLLHARGATVLARVQPALQTLLRRNFPHIRFPNEADPASHDWHCPMLSLPHAFGTTLDTVPCATPYLTACPSKRAAWRNRLSGLRGLKVGLVWEGAPLLGMAEFRAMNTRRSIPNQALAPLAGIAGVDLVSLQFGTAPPPALNLVDAMRHVADFDDTAALVAELDLVIAVDTAVAHLAGALGKPVWVLSRFDTCWRWLANRRDSPWYPSLRLYRQHSPGDWGGVIAEAASDLAAARAPLWRVPAGANSA